MTPTMQCPVGCRPANYSREATCVDVVVGAAELM